MNIYNQSNYHLQLPSLQSSISQLENMFLKWKLNVSKLANASKVWEEDLVLEISTKIDIINTQISVFCSNFQGRLRFLQEQVSFMARDRNIYQTTVQQPKQDQRYTIIHDKISTLQQNLLKTQLNQQKLIDTINLFMMKYQIQEHPNLIKDDEYLKNRIRTSASLVTFKPVVSPNTLRRQNLMETTDRWGNTLKNENKIYLNDDYSNTSSQTLKSQLPQYVRTFSKPIQQPKISLRQNSNSHTNQIRPYNYNIQTITKVNNSSRQTNRPTSLDRHEHRFKFMMNKLND